MNTRAMATADPKETSTDADPVVDPPQSAKKKILIILVLMALIGGGLVWYFMFFNAHQEGDSRGKAKVVKHIAPIFLQMDTYTVNLKPDGQFLQATFTLQIETEAEVLKIKTFMPQIRSRLLLMLSNKTVEELSSLEGKKILSEQIEALVEEPFAEGLEQTKVSNVFFTSFVIQ
jgi:flagellar FliL protein